MAWEAGASAMGSYPRAWRLSMAWDMASIPVAAVIAGGKPTVTRGSRMATGGRRGGSDIRFFTLGSWSLMVANMVTSLAVPEVVGIAMWGTMGSPTLPNPKNSRRSFLPFLAKTQMALVVSIVEPPPM